MQTGLYLILIIKNRLLKTFFGDEKFILTRSLFMNFINTINMKKFDGVKFIHIYIL